MVSQIYMWLGQIYTVYVIRYTFAQTLIVLTPNSASPQGPWTADEQTDILIGIENADEFTQANLDEKRIAYSVGVMYSKYYLT